MNLPLTHRLEDVQNTPDKRQLTIDRVGIKSLRYPIFFQSHTDTPIRVVADFNMYVHLAADVKGTHMSRFVELLEKPDLVFSLRNMSAFMTEMLELLGAQHGHVSLRFPYFITKAAPVSGVKSVMDYDITLTADYTDTLDLTVKAEIPVTSLCPCSKKISDYGAHNQRSLVTVEARINEDMTLDTLIQLIEEQASSQLYGLLKRPDEKYVTEFAYDNPKFVEDLVRDIAVALAQQETVSGFRVECENFESIHNHSAYAVIDQL
ncbi:MAG: GTP cyclohydrolase I FolE2 [Methylophaga sp.]|jgi:GTP cyclohydrolase I|uniref:GTP cyclohydrolase FolE2 n=1 Tax=Methylophaga sp. UBA678 TaxID=1946901 RepID=UPI000C63B492|nr:GTP cyclohydrolase FolE2 [Methylophaga sp. UBA678]MAX52444.1 GTP cyclohydrolase I FolE2 [Methylophaga sp.]|tara:strand:- start:129982 stop:130770 length:789 start_codon:yes stop_codon:yes gene_type:complete